jgi:hypothetical protein
MILWIAGKKLGVFRSYCLLRAAKRMQSMPSAPSTANGSAPDCAGVVGTGLKDAETGVVAPAFTCTLCDHSW